MVEALECSVDLESAAVKLGVIGIEDLAICLNALARTCCKLGEFDKAMVALDHWAECGSICSALAIEDNSAHMHKTPSYEWIQDGQKRGGRQRQQGGGGNAGTGHGRFIFETMTRHPAPPQGVSHVASSLVLFPAIRQSILYLEGSQDPNMMSEVVPRFEPFERCCMGILFVGGRGKTTPHTTSPPPLLIKSFDCGDHPAAPPLSVSDG